MLQMIPSKSKWRENFEKWEKVFINYISDKRLASEYIKNMYAYTHTHISVKTQQFKNKQHNWWTKGSIDISPKRIQH